MVRVAKKKRRAKAPVASPIVEVRNLLLRQEDNLRASFGEISRGLSIIRGFSDRLAGIEANINALHVSYVNLEALYRGSRPVVDNLGYSSIEEKLDSAVLSQKSLIERQNAEINALKLRNAELSASLGPMRAELGELMITFARETNASPARKKVKRK